MLFQFFITRLLINKSDNTSLIFNPSLLKSFHSKLPI